MRTISGVDVKPGGTSAPTLYDIGYGCAALIRFGGHVRRLWSVLEHSYACWYYADYCGDSLAIQLHVLLHDAHECVTGEIPRPWKTDDFRARQKEVDRRIYTVHGLPFPTEEEAKRVHEIDNIMLVAETALLGPPTNEELKPDPRAIRAIMKTQAHMAYTKVEQIAEEYVAIVTALKGSVIGQHSNQDPVPEVQQTA